MKGEITYFTRNQFRFSPPLVMVTRRPEINATNHLSTYNSLLAQIYSLQMVGIIGPAYKFIRNPRVNIIPFIC